MTMIVLEATVVINNTKKENFRQAIIDVLSSLAPYEEDGNGTRRSLDHSKLFAEDGCSVEAEIQSAADPKNGYDIAPDGIVDRAYAMLDEAGLVNPARHVRLFLNTSLVPYIAQNPDYLLRSFTAGPSMLDIDYTGRFQRDMKCRLEIPEPAFERLVKMYIDAHLLPDDIR